MNVTFNIPDSLLEPLRKAAAADSRSLASYVLLVLRESLGREAKPRMLPAWDAPKQEATKAREMDRPYRGALLAHGWSADWLDSLTRAQEARLMTNGQRPDASGVALAVMTPDEAQVFCEVPIAPAETRLTEDVNGDLNFED